GVLDENLIGRCLLEDADTGKEIILKAGEYITNMAKIQEFADAGLESVKIRTVVTCQAEHGVCQKCYGWDLTTAHPVNLGTAVGIIAAQSIGEPGTQLTMRTFHTGGVAGDDITHGLPRVQELFEARVPKSAAALAEFDGTMQLIDTKGERKIVVYGKDGDVVEYDISQRAQLMPGVFDGSEVQQGQQLTKGSVAPKDLLRLTDPYTTLRYIVREVQNVYVSQGVDINDKHIEVIARQMLRRVVVQEAGDTDLVVGSQINRFEYEKLRKKCKEEGTNPPVAKPILLGIAKASLASDSFLSAASFQETTKILTDASLEGKVDHLEGLKENVITGHHIPAGTGLKRYRNVGITYHDLPILDYETDKDYLPECAPCELIEAEQCMPTKEEWERTTGSFIDFSKEGMPYSEEINESRRSLLSDAQCKLRLDKDLVISTRWVNKFSQHGIESVGDLIERNEDDLIRMEGIGIKAIEELKEALEARDLGFVLENTLQASTEEMNTFVDVIFSPQGEEYMIGESESGTLLDDEELIGISQETKGASGEAIIEKTGEELMEELLENKNIEDGKE
ncbi:MAG: DNA-directed RNA polymerase subunit beta', partial [Eggerthellaceae bacterium]|nr:DNA-directed RNA polymerase subunit beta' [Eggerthellaceae bacterium]